MRLPPRFRLAVVLGKILTMILRRPTSLRGKLLLVSVATSITLGLAFGLAWLYVEALTITKETTRDNYVLRDQLTRILKDEFREEHSDISAARHVARAFFHGSDILRAEVTTPRGKVLASKSPGAEGKISYDADEIKTSVREKAPLVEFWQLRRPGDLTGKQEWSGLSIVSLRPKAQEFTAPVMINGKTRLVLHVYISMQRLTDELRRLILYAFLIISVITVLSATTTFVVLDRWVYKPILALDDVAERIAAGDTAARAEVDREDEFGDLAMRFNAMTDSLIHAQYQADTDALTGLFNYRHLQNYLAAQLALAKRYGRGLTVVMLDIDHFKGVNDVYGHQAGDGVLRLTANFLLSQLRQADYAARYGGEEFVIILPETKAEEAVQVLDRILAGFPEHVFVEQKGVRHPVFISLGVADFPDCGQDATNLLASADMALLLSKRHGRNRITYFRALGGRTELG